jgi:arginase
VTRRLAVIDAPSNLGLRPPGDDCVPGVYKLPGALRDAGVVRRLDALDRGVVVPPRYHGAWDGAHTRNEAAIAGYTPRLAERVERSLAANERPLVLGGDCSVLLGAALALRRRGRYGLVFVDGHSDFRHAGNSDAVRSAAGEDLALVTGRGAPVLTDIDGLTPYVRVEDVTLLGVRDDDPDLAELRSLDAHVVEAGAIGRLTSDEVVTDVAARLSAQPVDGFWVHLDADVADPEVFPAVDSPAPGGLRLDALTAILTGLAALPAMAGLDVTILDPDLDPDGRQARALAGVLEAALTHRG